MTHYQHTQPGTLLRYVLGVCAVLAAASALATRGAPSFAVIPLVVAATVAVALALFHSLTVTVSSDEIFLAFGPGLIRKRYAVADVASAAASRSRWYHGWGLKWIPHGWQYNVSGFEAVDLELRNGRRVRIGTDQPAELLAAVERAIDGAG